MSLTLDAIKNSGLSPSLRRGAREGEVRDLCILTSYGGGRQTWKFCTRGAAHRMYTSPPSPLVVLLEQSRKPLQHIRRFGCTPRELRELVAWLHEFGVERAEESPCQRSLSLRVARPCRRTELDMCRERTGSGNPAKGTGFPLPTATLLLVV